MLLGGGLAAGGFLRVYISNGDMHNASAISLSLFFIVMTSVVLGSSLPFALAKVGERGGYSRQVAGMTVGCLAGWLGSCLAGWLSSCLAGWLGSCLAGWLAGWQGHWLPALPCWLASWLAN